MASVHDELAAVALAADDPEGATAELAWAEQLRREIGAPLPAAEQAARDQTLNQARARLGNTFPALTLAGRSRSRH
jgi:hypothetical protein